MNTFQLKDAKTVPDIVHEYTKDLRNNKVPIIIDNGVNILIVFSFFLFFLQSNSFFELP